MFWYRRSRRTPAPGSPGVTPILLESSRGSGPPLQPSSGLCGPRLRPVGMGAPTQFPSSGGQRRRAGGWCPGGPWLVLLGLYEASGRACAGALGALAPLTCAPPGPLMCVSAKRVFLRDWGHPLEGVGIFVIGFLHAVSVPFWGAGCTCCGSGSWPWATEVQGPRSAPTAGKEGGFQDSCSPTAAFF